MFTGGDDLKLNRNFEKNYKKFNRPWNSFVSFDYLMLEKTLKLGSRYYRSLQSKCMKSLTSVCSRHQEISRNSTIPNARYGKTSLEQFHAKRKTANRSIPFIQTISTRVLKTFYFKQTAINVGVIKEKFSAALFLITLSFI